VAGGGIAFRLADGSDVLLREDEVARVFAILWQLAPGVPGAVACAGQLDHARRQPLAGHRIDLTAREAEALRLAIERVQAAPPIH
jgi:hypothetical protein